MLKNLFGASNAAAYSFFMGAALRSDVDYARNAQVEKVIIGGNAHLKEAAAMLLEEYMAGRVLRLSDAAVEASVPLGLVKIFECEI